MNFKTLTLLSLKEYKQYMSLISAVDGFWWLCTPGNLGYSALCVDYNGYVDPDGYCVYFDDIGIRPALKIGIESDDPTFWYKADKLVGLNIKYGKYTWTVLNVQNGEMFVLCDEIIEEHRFDENTNIWEISELKAWLEAEGLKLITT